MSPEGSVSPDPGSAKKFEPYVSAQVNMPEFTVRAVVLGVFFGLLFGAVTVYVGLRAGLAVNASIPISVLSISILRAFGRSTILENNIVQTTGSAGESIAAGVIFTLPALIFLGFSLEYSRIFLLTLIGGWLGVFFMIPLRRQLIVKEHGHLTYPEGTACADVLIAGDRGGSFASRVFWGLGLGGIYTLFQNENLFALWPSTPTYNPPWLPGGSFRANTTSEYLGVGYIIGPRVAGVIFAGGVFSWLVMMPAIKFFGSAFPQAIYPGTMPIAQMSPNDIWASYIRPMGAGGVAAAGVITLAKTIPTILAALKGSAARVGGALGARVRTDDDLSTAWTLGGSVALVLAMWAMLSLKPVPGAYTSVFANLLASIFVVIFGFLFVTVSSRIVGLIGSSANPISGMTIATLMATTAIFFLLGWRAPAFGALAISIGGVVCIAAANGGNTSQDLKTGFLVGATPHKQQAALMVGVITSMFAIGITLTGMNRGLETFRELKRPIDVNQLPPGVAKAPQPLDRQQITVMHANGQSEQQPGDQYLVLNAVGSPVLPDGKYLYRAATGQIEVQWVQGIGSERAAAPQARLMSTVISGILSQRLPWRLVLMGVFVVVAIELLGIRSLPFAVGSYLSIATTMAIFVGGMMHWLVDRAAQKAGETREESEISPGSLYASGLIAAGGIVGLFGVALKLAESTGKIKPNALALHLLHPSSLLGGMIAVVTFIALACSLFHFARKPLK
jgi:putative OPT family oligopeptide transporter